jgi:hypothetical protein
VADPRTVRRRHFKADPIALGSVAISIVATVILGALKSVSAIDAAIVGLLIIAIGLVLELRYSEERREHLEKLLDCSTWLRASIAALAGVVNDISRDTQSEILMEEASRRFESFHGEMDQLQRGMIARGGSDATDLLRGIAECRAFCNAVTYLARDTDRSASWWAREVGRTYWQENLTAIARNVQITRVFIIDEFTEDVRAVLAEQAQAHVDVRYVLSDHLAEVEHNNFAIFDSHRAWEAKMNTNGVIVQNLFHLSRHELQRLNESFRVCLAHSTRYVPALPADSSGSSSSVPNQGAEPQHP